MGSLPCQQTHPQDSNHPFSMHSDQRIRATVNSQEQKRLLMDLDISMRTVDCPFTVTFYGALFREVGGSAFRAARQAVTEKDASRISQTPAVTGRFLVQLVFCREFHAREMLVQSWLETMIFSSVLSPFKMLGFPFSFLFWFVSFGRMVSINL